MAWVKSLDCCVCGSPADDAHHAIGMKLGGMGTKAPDDMTMPLCRGDHRAMHDRSELWPLQQDYISKTKALADELEVKYK